MNYQIHETAIVDDGAQIGLDTRIWQWTHVCSGAKIGSNVSLGQNVFVGKKAVIGNSCKIQNNVSIYDNVHLEDGVFCGPSVVFTNVRNPRSLVNRKDEYEDTLVKKGASLGANSTIICGTTIGEYAFIGAGAVVNQNVPAFALMVGIPAKQIGWMSVYGQRLNIPISGNAQTVCEYTRQKYKLKDGILSMEDINEDINFSDMDLEHQKSKDNISRIKIGIFGYDFPHFKTNSIVKDTFNNGFSIGAVFLAPKINFSDNNNNVISSNENTKNTEIREFCNENNIPFFLVDHNESSTIKNIVNSHRINIGLIGGALIINLATIELFKLGIINYHPGRIPETSGLHSIYRTIQHGIQPCITAHLIDEKVDAGLFIYESIVDVFKEDTIETVKNRVLCDQIELNYLVLKGIENGEFTFPKIIRPKKNNRLSNDEKKEISRGFDNWKNLIINHDN